MLAQVSEEVTPTRPLELSVIIPTRDRADTLLPAVQSVLADLPADGSAEVIVVDQGRDESAVQALASVLKSDARLRYVREASVGASVARNAGVRAAGGELIAFTDDDCTVEPGWAAALHETFAAHPEVGLIFGTVRAAPYDASLGSGIIPNLVVEDGPLTRKKMFASSYGCWGMSANMALRRSVWEQVGPFDALMGPGAPLGVAEDIDYGLRAVSCGVGVYHSGRASVVHYGFRPRAVTSKLMKGYAFGKGAMYAKQLRAGSALGRLLLLNDVVTLTRIVLFNAVRGHRPLGANALIYEVKGLWRGVWLPLERRQQLVFRGQGETAGAAAEARQQQLPA